MHSDWDQDEEDEQGPDNLNQQLDLGKEDKKDTHNKIKHTGYIKHMTLLNQFMNSDTLTFVLRVFFKFNYGNLYFFRQKIT